MKRVVMETSQIILQNDLAVKGVLYKPYSRCDVHKLDCILEKKIVSTYALRYRLCNKSEISKWVSQSMVLGFYIKMSMSQKPQLSK